MKDKQARDVQIRIQGALSYLHSSDARYHLIVDHSNNATATTLTTADLIAVGSICSHVVKTLEGNMSDLNYGTLLIHPNEGAGGARCWWEHRIGNSITGCDRNFPMVLQIALVV